MVGGGVNCFGKHIVGANGGAANGKSMDLPLNRFVSMTDEVDIIDD